MHRCLQLPEIILQVLEEFTWSSYAHRPANIDRKTVLALTLSSKHFLEPGLDTLWGSLETPRALRQFFGPSDPNRFSRATRDSDNMDLIQSFKVADHRRFDYYATRVKLISVSASDAIDKEYWRIIFLGFASHRLPFPNLRVLDWAIGGNDLYSFSCFQLLVGEKLTSLSLTIPEWQLESHGPLSVVLWSVKDACPNLEYLELAPAGGEPTDTSGDQIALVISSLPSPSHVLLYAEPSSDGWLCLSKMRRLHTLQGYFEPKGFQMADVTASLIRPLEFPVLQHLSWSAEDLDEHAVLFRGFHRRHDLQSLGLEVYNCSTIPETHAFIDALTLACSPDALKSFSIEMEDYSHPTGLPTDPFMPYPTAPALDILRPLLAFRRIEVCEIDSCVVIWDDALLKEISTAWPNLRRLKLQTGHEPPLSKVTLPGLTPIAQNCPYIERLMLTVGAESSAWANMQTPHRTWGHGPGGTVKTSVALELLYHSPVDITGYKAFVRLFLEAIFPHTSQVHLSGCHCE